MIPLLLLSIGTHAFTYIPVHIGVLMLDQYTGRCMVLIHNINDGIKEPTHMVYVSDINNRLYQSNTGVYPFDSSLSHSSNRPVGDYVS